MSARKVQAKVLEALSPTEQAAVLADLLTAHPELVEDAERLAAARLERVDRGDVAGEVASSLQSLTVEDIWERGRQELGFVHENEAAWMAAEEEVQPYLDGMRRAATLGMHTTARETCWGSSSACTSVGTWTTSPGWVGHPRRTSPPSTRRTFSTNCATLVLTCRATSWPQRCLSGPHSCNVNLRDDSSPATVGQQ